MDNQHRKIKGYRELSEDEINLMNEIKAKGEELGELVEKIESKFSGHLRLSTCEQITKTELEQLRWIWVAKTNLQQGLMALTRSVAMPETF